MLNGGHQEGDQSNDDHQQRKGVRADQTVFLAEAGSFELKELVNRKSERD